MCGICGIAGYKEDPVKSIEAMKNALIRRGPDDDGNFIDANKQVVIGHRRLSIIDLTDTGSQPMKSLNGQYVIAFNGEIYNAGKLRSEMEVYNGRLNLRGTSDTEILLEAIASWGLKTALEKCRGMWAISLYDRSNGDIMLTRDRIGEKPLYYGKVGGQFVWASDLNAISVVPGAKLQVDKRIIPIYLRYGYIPAPYTIYKDVYKLEPGTILKISAPYDEWKIERYYDISEVAGYGQSHRFTGSEEEAADRLEMLLKDALRGQMLSDVPLGAFLSGGVDSTVVVSMMQQLSSSDSPVRTFTIGFEEKEFNEAAFAAETAKHLGTKHTEMYVGYKDVMDLLPELAYAYGEPFGDSSQLPTMLVSKMTKQHVTVALSGDAGDELFCGYNTYKDARNGLSVLQNKLSFLKGGLRSGVGKAVDKLDRITVMRDGTLSDNIHKANQVLNTDTIEGYYRAMNDNADVYRLILPDQETIDPPKIIETIYPDGLMQEPENNLMLMDMLQYLPDDILTKVDRAGMFYSLETRIPLLDADVIDFAWSLPLEYKMDGGITKKILRNILYRHVPRELMDRPKKGFSVPVNKWLWEGDMRMWAETLMDDAKAIASDYIDVQALNSIWYNYQTSGKWSKIIWHALMLEAWLIK